MSLDLIVDTVLTIGASIASAFAVFYAKVKARFSKEKDFLISLTEKVREIIEICENLTITSAEKKTQAMKMIKEYIVAKHQTWLIWEKQISNMIDSFVDFANKVGQHKGVLNA